MRLILSIVFSIVALTTSSADVDLERRLSKHLDLTKLQALKTRINEQIKMKLAKTPEEQKELEEQLAAIGSYKLPKDERDGDENQINFNAGLSKDLFEGDMMLTDAQLDEFEVFDSRNASRARRQAQKGTRFPTNTWGKNPTIPYSFDRSYPSDGLNQDAIRGAIKYWEANTCIRFREGGSGSDRVKFIFDDGCYSYVGRIGGEQEVSIGDGCGSIGTVAHELSHTFGIFHVQSRYDRNDYVMVNERNIENDALNNFDMESQQSTDNYGLPYEFGSNMHYGEGDFGIDSSLPALVARRGQEQYQHSMKGRLPTFYDIMLVNKYYNCYDNCSNKISCANGGVQDVNKCAQCKCPSGWSGPTCEQRPPGTKTIDVSASPQQLVLKAGRGNEEESLEFDSSYALLRAPSGRRIRLQVNGMNGISGGDCHWGGAEIQHLRDPRLAGIKICDPKRQEKDIVSEGETMFITVFNRQYDNVYQFTATLV